MVEKNSDNSFRNIIIGIFTAAIVGIILLIFEYKTPFFKDNGVKTLEDKENFYEDAIPEKNKWITCDENFSIINTYFTWTGPRSGTCKVSLENGEFVIGTADIFQQFKHEYETDSKCTGFLLLGPLEIEITIDRGGGGDFYSNNTSQIENLFLEKNAELDIHPTCNCETGRCYNIIRCDQFGCKTQ